MLRLPQRTSNRQNDGTEQLLQTLLQSPVDTRSPELRPVTLCSSAEQREIALRSFRRRTWVDRALYRVERLLLLAVVGFFAFWLANGYGRDWLHTYQQRQPAALLPAVAAQTVYGAVLTSTAVLTASEPMSQTIALTSSQPMSQTLAVTSGGGIQQEHAFALPFTPAEVEREARYSPRSADYLAPQALPVPRQRVDLRPQRLIIPTIGVDTAVQEVFIEHSVWQVADYAAGYHHGSALPGENGNTVMAGHAGLRGAVFRDLGQLQKGDEVLVDAGNWRYRYQVRQRISVWPTQVEVMEPTPKPTLTLITCTAWDTQRLVVIADLIESRPL